MLVATAGHIDHGKTALIRALTGVETDRLPEERARGMSIDLGFAYWRPDEGDIIGFIDAPGHERFVRNMLAGVAGVAAALLVVAADDGVMPQTREHLAILDLLGIDRALVAITKCDRADAGRIAEVRDRIAALIAPTTLADAPMFEVSAVTGAGIAELGAALRRLRDRADQPDQSGQDFRFAIDRAFTVAGAGSVVTGTVMAGRLTVGEPLVLSPAGLETRARGLQVAGESIGEVRAGQRCAINLAGMELSALARGDWLVTPSQHAPTERLDVTLKLSAGREQPLRHNTPVHCHIGTADIAARVLLPGGRAAAPGASITARLALETPTSAVTGLRFVLRDQAARDVLGGGRVIDPFVPARTRRSAPRAAAMQAMASAGAPAALAALLAIPGFEIDTQWFARCWNLDGLAAAALFAAENAVLLDTSPRIAISANRHVALGQEIVAALGAFHAEYPDRGGPTARELRARLAPEVSAAALKALLRELAGARRIDASGPMLRLPTHIASFSAAETSLWQAALAALDGAGPKPIVLAELARELRCPEAAARAMLFRRRINGDLWAVTDSKFMLREHVAALAASAARIAAAHDGRFSAAQFRDATGIGRNFVIQLLEFFDRIGVTARRGDARVMTAYHAAIVGAAGD